MSSKTSASNSWRKQSTGDMALVMLAATPGLPEKGSGPLLETELLDAGSVLVEEREEVEVVVVEVECKLLECPEEEELASREELLLLELPCLSSIINFIKHKALNNALCFIKFIM